MILSFEKACLSHLDTLFKWLAEPHVQEFWDNTPDHKEDILKFVNGRAEPSSYADGNYVYWIAYLDKHPFAMIMTIQETKDSDIGELKLAHLSTSGNTYGIDYMIGEKQYLGKDYGAKTLAEFVEFFRSEIDTHADTFFIDPASDNPRAKHVYMQAGFNDEGNFIMHGNVSGVGKLHSLLVKRFGHSNTEI